MLLKKLGVFLFLLFGGIVSTTANSQQNQIWDPMFDEIRMTKKPNTSEVFQDVMTFKFGEYWTPYPFRITLDDATIALFLKVKGPNDPNGNMTWDQNWSGEIWSADRAVPDVEASLIATFDNSTEAVIIPRDKIYENTQLIVRIKGTREDGTNVLYDQFFLTLSTEPGEGNGTTNTGEAGQDPTVIIQVPCYITSLSPFSSLVESAGGNVDLAITTSLENCTWTPSTTSNWLSIPETEYTGNGNIQVTVQENTTNDVRVGVVVVNGYEFTVVQKGVPVVIPEPTDYGYTTTINPANIIVDPGEFTGSFEVVVGNQEVEWNIEVDDITVVEGPTTRTGNSTVNYRVLENTSEEGRIGTITAAGGKFFVYQKGVVPPPVESEKFITSFDPNYGAYPSGYPEGTVSYSLTVKTSSPTCSWEATVNPLGGGTNWVTITNQSGSGTGTGVITFTVERNKGNSPRFAEIRVTTSDGNYRVFPLVQDKAYDPKISRWARRYPGPTENDFSVSIGNYTLVNSNGELVKLAFEESVKDVPWTLWVSPPITPGVTTVNEMIASGVGDSWDAVSYENALGINIPENTLKIPLTDISETKVYKVFMNFTPQQGFSVFGDPYYIIQRAKPQIVTETVIQEVEVPSKFIKNVIPPFTVVQGSGGNFTFNVEPSVEDCSWQANVSADWVGLVEPQPAGVPVPPLNELPKTLSFVGQKPLAFAVGENNTSDVRITLISMSVWPQGFIGTFEESGAFVNGYHTIIQVPKPGAIRLIIDGQVDVIPTTNIPFNVNVTYQQPPTQPTP